MTENKKVAIKINNLGKQYRLGTIGGGTLTADLQSWWAKVRGKEDPNSKIGSNPTIDGSNAAGLSKGDSFWALKDINLEIYAGEAVGIIGHNGAGKSTLLKILSRVTAPTEGTAELNGRVSSMLEVGTGFHQELTGRENIYMNGAILGMSRKEVDEKIEDIIEFSECRQFIDTPVKRYSSGMYVKLAFAVAAHLDAEIMIMDEVLAVGDVKFQKKCLGQMDSAAHNEGKTVLYVSHNMSTIRQLCSRCIVMDHGNVVYDGDVEKAIEYYVGLVDTDRVAHIDLDNCKRPDGFGVAFRILEIDFVNKQEAVFSSDEKVTVQIHWYASQDLEDIYIRYEVENMDSTPVGMAESHKLGQIEANSEGFWNLEWDISNIVEGSYQIILDVYNKNEFGTYSSYDHPFRKIVIDIKSPSNSYEMNTVWNRTYWNSVRLNPIIRTK